MRDERLEVLLSREKIAQRVSELAADISRDYDGKNLLLLCVLKGAVIFLADLVRDLTVSPRIDFVRAFSYDGTSSTGNVSFSLVSERDIAANDILIVEDILDTGLTYKTLAEALSPYRPASLKLCVLLDKPSARRVEPIRADYVGFTIPDKFVVGYGLDFRERYRELKDICTLGP